MNIKKGKKFYLIEDFYKLSFKDMAQFLNCFKKDNEYLLFHEYKINLNNMHIVDKELKEFYRLIVETSKFISKEWFFKWECPFIEFLNGIPESVWYHPENNEQMILVLKKRYLFNSIVLGEDKSFKEISYIIEHVERNSEEFNGFYLEISETEEGDFIGNVLPKLREVVKDISIEDII